MTFGERVLSLRKKRQLTRRKLAQLSGLHETHVAKVERGERTHLELETIVGLARALACTTDYLLGMHEERLPQ